MRDSKESYYSHETIMGYDPITYEIMVRKFWRGEYYQFRKGNPWIPEWFLRLWVWVWRIRNGK